VSFPIPSPVTPDRLRRALALPSFDGRAAQRRLEPVRRGGPPPRAATEAPRPAAALAYLFERDGRLRLPLTVRREDLPEHRGQVSLPGGRPAPGEDLWTTAAREALEETGLVLDGALRLGTLTPVYIPITHTKLHVHVALGPEPGPLAPCPREVERIVIVRLDDLVDPANVGTRTLTIQGRQTEVPFFDVQGLFLWGATAMALSELVERLRAATR